MYFFESIIALLLRCLCTRQTRRTLLVATVTCLVLSSFTDTLVFSCFAVVTWFLAILIPAISLAYVNTIRFLHVSVVRLSYTYGRRKMGGAEFELNFTFFNQVHTQTHAIGTVPNNIGVFHRLDSSRLQFIIRG